MKPFLFRVFALNLIVAGILFMTGCNASWTSQAINIIALLEPAILSALGIVTAFGVGITPTALTALQAWSEEAQTALREVALLIQQYNAAEATAKPGILAQIDTFLKLITVNLSALLPELHITDPVTRARIMAVVGSIESELLALEALLPVLQGKTSPTHAQFRALMHQLKSADEFEDEFNAQAGSFGDQYKISKMAVQTKPGHDVRGDFHEEFRTKPTANDEAAKTAAPPVEPDQPSTAADFADAHKAAAVAAHGGEVQENKDSQPEDK